MSDQKELAPQNQRIIAALEKRLLKSQKDSSKDRVIRIIGVLIGLIIAARLLH